MGGIEHMKHRRLPGLVAAGICFLLAVGFRFAAIGYGVIALTLAFAGICILLYLFLPKTLRIVLTVLLLLGLAVFITAEIPVVKAAKGTPDADADYLIVLGAGVNGSVPSLSMIDRLTAAKLYLDAHPDCVAVVSGGQGPGEHISEAKAMSDWLTARGVASDRIILEDRATSTVENLSFSLMLIPDAQSASIAVCSSEYHLYRAEYMAQEMGYQLAGIPGKTSYPILRMNYFIREGLGVVYYRVFGI